MNKVAILLLLFLHGEILIAQNHDLECCCSNEILQQAIVPTPVIREADASWSNTLIREIDLKQKLNQTYYLPIDPNDGYLSLFDLMVKEVLGGCMKAYRANQFSMMKNDVYLSILEFDEIVNSMDTVQVEHYETGDWTMTVLKSSINTSQITGYRLKEQWIFDRQRSRMFSRLIAFAPLLEVYGEDGSFRGFKELFWVNYEESRKILAAYPSLLGSKNDQTITYDDLLAKKYYDGYIIKESNVYDRYLFEYTHGIEMLLEGERIEKKIRDIESDMWSN